jgi:hypothetical protein
MRANKVADVAKATASNCCEAAGVHNGFVEPGSISRLRRCACPYIAMPTPSNTSTADEHGHFGVHWITLIASLVNPQQMLQGAIVAVEAQAPR